jgi:hypothetical protein
MVLVSLLIAPALMAAAASVERRLGPSAAGWVAALPLSLAVAVAAVTFDAGGHAAWTVALSAATHVPAQVAFAVVFAAVLTRRGLLAGVAAGALAYLVLSIGLAGAPNPLALAAAIPAVVLAPRLMTEGRPRPGSPRAWQVTALTCAVTVLIVAGTLVVTRVAGPVTAGAVAAFPTMSTTLVFAVATRDGRPAGAHSLVGLVRSLPCYLTFCLLVVVALPSLGLAAIAPALLGCVAAGCLTWRRVPVAVCARLH